MVNIFRRYFAFFLFLSGVFCNRSTANDFEDRCLDLVIKLEAPYISDSIKNSSDYSDLLSLGKVPSLHEQLDQYSKSVEWRSPSLAEKLKESRDHLNKIEERIFTLEAILAESMKDTHSHQSQELNFQSIIARLEELNAKAQPRAEVQRLIKQLRQDLNWLDNSNPDSPDNLLKELQSWRPSTHTENANRGNLSDDNKEAIRPTSLHFNDKVLESYYLAARHDRNAKAPPGVKWQHDNHAVLNALQILERTTSLSQLGTSYKVRKYGKGQKYAGYFGINAGGQFRIIFHWDNVNQRAIDLIVDDFHG